MGSNCCKGDAAGGPLRSSSSIYSRYFWLVLVLAQECRDVPWVLRPTLFPRPSRAGASLEERFTTSTDAGGVRLTVSAAQTSDTGVYTLQASNAKGSDTARVRLEVAADEAPTGDDPPTFLRRLQDLTVKVGTRTRFLVEIVSSTECKVTWYRNERRLLEAERVSLVRDGHFWCADVSAVSVDDAGRWTCTAENAGGRASCSAHLNVLVPKAYKRPEFVEELRALLTEQGTVSLECKVVGVPTPVLRWFKDSREIKAGDVFALTANAEDPTSLGTYTCEAVNCMGRAYSSSKIHVVGRASREGSAKPSSSMTEPPPIFTKELEGQAVKICEPLALACQLVVPPWPKSVVWYNKEGKVEPGERYHVLEDGVGGYLVEVGSAEWRDEGEWKCVATSSGGRVGISTAYVSMEVPKNYRKPRFMENLQAVLTEEGLVSFECKVVGFPTPLLSWFKDGQELKPGDVYQLTGTNSLGSYCCIARNCMGSASSSAELTVEDIQNQLNEEEKLQLFAKNQAPKFVQGLKSVEAKIDEPFRFTVKVQIPPEPAVLWYRDDQPVDESTRCRLAKEDRGLFHLDINTLEFLDQAEWKCVATNDFGHSVTSCFLKLIIPRHYKKPRFLENLQAILSDEGAVNLECKVIGVPQPVLKWYKDGEELKPGDIHRIISGQDGTCCLGTYTCEARNCMGIAASSASLLGFDDSMKAKKKKAEEQALQRNLSLSTIHEERTSQMYDTPVGDITLDDKGEISFSFDGKEVSVSLYETPDLTEEEALQIVEMYADQLSENVTEHNVVELPPLRFVKETSTSGNLLMEAIIIDVSPEYFVAPEEDLRTEADVEDISIADENGPPQLSLDADIEGEDYLEKTMAILSEERSDVSKVLSRKKSDSVKSGDDFFSLSRDPSLVDDKRDDDTQVSESFASARSASAKAKSKSSKPSDEEFKDISEAFVEKPVLEPSVVKEVTKKHAAEPDQSPAVKPKRERRSSRGSRRSSSGSEKSLSRSKDEPRKSKEREESRRSKEKDEPRRSKEKEEVQKIKESEATEKKIELEPEQHIRSELKLTDEEFKSKISNISLILSKIINEVQIIERDIILKSELMSSAATASRSLEIISNIINPLSEIHSISDAMKESDIESKEVTSSLFNSLPQPLKSLHQTLTIIEKCIEVESESKTLIKRTCVAFINACGEDMQRLMSELNSVTSKNYLFIQENTLSDIVRQTKEVSSVLKNSAAFIKNKNLTSEISEEKMEESSVETKHLKDTQKAVFELRSPLNSLLRIAESADSGKMVDVAKVKHSEVILTDMSGSIQDLQTALEQIESLSVKESTTLLHKYNTEIIETVMESVLKLRSSFEQLSTETKSEEDWAVLKQVLASIKFNLSDISSQIDNIERNFGTFDILQSENKLEVLQKMAQILIALENNLPRLEVMPAIKSQMDIFHKNLTKVLENVIESNDAKKYFILMEICDAVNRINSSIKNIDAECVLSLASLGNTLTIIQDYFVKNVFEPELNCSILSNIADILIGIQESINHAEEVSMHIDSEHIQEISTMPFDATKANIIIEHIEHTIAAISNVKSMETAKELKTAMMPVLENLCPVLEELKYTVAAAKQSKVEQHEEISEMSDASLVQTLATPICDLHQNIVVLTQTIVENLESIRDSSAVISTVAEPLHELYTTLEVLQQDVISQYGESIATYDVSVNMASAVQNLQSCILMIQEQAGVEVVDEMSTLEDISGIKTTADTIPSDRLVLPTAAETPVEQALKSLSQDLADSATAQALLSLNEHITVLQTPEIIDALDSLSEISDFSSLKSVALGLGELHAGIEELLHPVVMENTDDIGNLISTTKLTAIAEPMQELQQSLSILDMSNIPVYEHILELPTERLHSVLNTINEFKKQLGKCITAVFPAMETAEKTIEISNKVETLREICEHLNDIIKTTKVVSQEVPVKQEVLVLEETVNNLVDATDVSKGIKIENVKAITEKLYENILTVQEEIIQFTPQTPEKISYEAQLIQTIDEIENNIAVLEQYEFVDLSRASDITSCTSPQLAMELDSESLLQMDDIVENAVNVVQDSTQDTPMADLMIIEDFFKSCKSEFTILRCLMTKQLSHKKIIRILQEFSLLQSTINDFRAKRSDLRLSEDIDSYLTTFLIHADDCLKNVQQSLIKIVQSQSEVLFKTPKEKLQSTKKTLKNISKGKISPQIAEVARKFDEIIDATKEFVDNAETAVIEELKDSSKVSSTIQVKDLSAKIEEMTTFVKEVAVKTPNSEAKEAMEKILSCIHKHEDYRDAVGTGKTLIIIKCLSECSDILQESITGLKPKSEITEHQIEDSRLKAVLTEMLEPLQALHSQLISVQEQVLSGVEEDTISVDIPSTESLVQTMNEIHKEIQQVNLEQPAVNIEEISLIMEVDKEIHSIQDSIRSMENIPLAQVVKDIAKPIEDIEKSLHNILSPEKEPESKGKLPLGKAKELIQLIDKYIELIEIVEEVSVVIKIDDLKDTVDVARELRENFAAIEFLPDVKEDVGIEIEISLHHSGLALKLQRAITALHVQVLDSAEELAPALGTDVLQKIVQVTAQLQADLVAVTGVQVPLQSPLQHKTEVARPLIDKTGEIAAERTHMVDVEDKHLLEKDTQMIVTEVQSPEETKQAAEKVISEEASIHLTKELKSEDVISKTTPVIEEQPSLVLEKSEDQEKSKLLCAEPIAVFENLLQHIEEFISEDTIEIVGKICQSTDIEVLKQSVETAQELRDCISVLHEGTEGQTTEDLITLSQQEQAKQLAQKLQDTFEVLQVAVLDSTTELTSRIDQHAVQHAIEVVTQLKDDVNAIVISSKIIEHDLSLDISKTATEPIEVLTEKSEEAICVDTDQPVLEKIEELGTCGSPEESTKSIEVVETIAVETQQAFITETEKSTEHEPEKSESIPDQKTSENKYESETKHEADECLISKIEQAAEKSETLPIVAVVETEAIASQALSSMDEKRIAADSVVASQVDVEPAPVEEAAISPELDAATLEQAVFSDTLLQHIDDYICTDVVEVIGKLAAAGNNDELMQSIKIAQDLQENISKSADVHTVETCEEWFDENSKERANLAQQLQTALVSVQHLVLENAMDTIEETAKMAVQKAIEVTKQLQNDLIVLVKSEQVEVQDMKEDVVYKEQSVTNILNFAPDALLQHIEEYLSDDVLKVVDSLSALANDNKIKESIKLAQELQESFAVSIQENTEDTCNELSDLKRIEQAKLAQHLQSTLNSLQHVLLESTTEIMAEPYAPIVQKVIEVVGNLQTDLDAIVLPKQVLIQQAVLEKDDSEVISHDITYKSCEIKDDTEAVSIIKQENNLLVEETDNIGDHMKFIIEPAEKITETDAVVNILQNETEVPTEKVVLITDSGIVDEETMKIVTEAENVAECQDKTMTKASDTLLQHVNEYLSHDVVEVINQVAASVNNNELKETIKIAQDLKKFITDTDKEWSTEKNIEQVELAQKLQIALISFKHLVFESATDTMAAIGDKAVLKTIEVATQLQNDLNSIVMSEQIGQIQENLDAIVGKEFIKNDQSTPAGEFEIITEEQLLIEPQKNMILETKSTTETQQAAILKTPGNNDDVITRDENTLVQQAQINYIIDHDQTDILLQHIEEFVSDDVVEVINKFATTTNNDELKQSIKVAQDLLESFSVSGEENKLETCKEWSIEKTTEQAQLAQMLQVALISLQNIAVECIAESLPREDSSIQKVVKVVTQLQDDLKAIKILEQPVIRKIDDSVTEEGAKHLDVIKEKDENPKTFAGILVQHIEEFISVDIIQTIDKLATPENVDELKRAVMVAQELREKITGCKTGAKSEIGVEFTREVQAEKAHMAQQLQTALSTLQLVALESTFDPAPNVSEDDLQHVLDVVTQLQDDLAIVAAIEQVIVHKVPAEAKVSEKPEEEEVHETTTALETEQLSKVEKITILEDEAKGKLDKPTLQAEDEEVLKYPTEETETAAKLPERAGIIQHIEDFISEQISGAENLALIANMEQLKTSVELAKDLRETIAVIETLASSEETVSVAEEARVEQAKLAQKLQNALSTLQTEVFDSAQELAPSLDIKAIQRVSEAVTHLQEDLTEAFVSIISKDVKVVPETIEENSMKHLEELLQEVSDKIITNSTEKSVEDTEALRDTLDEVQTVIIKLKRDCDGAGNDTLNETLDDLECSVRSVQLQINEDSPPELLKEACATLQLLANNMSETQEVHITGTITKESKSENVLEKCSQEANDTVKLLEAVSKIDTKDLTQLTDIVSRLTTLKNALLSLRLSFSGDAETLIEKGVDVVQSLNQIEEKVFSLEKDVENEKSLALSTKENILVAVHSIYGSISNMRSTISTIQKQYMYESYGKPSESLLRSIKNVNSILNSGDKQIDTLNWKKISKSLRTVLNHFEDVKFYVNLDKTARLPSDAAFTKVILEELKLNINDVIFPFVRSTSPIATKKCHEILKSLESTFVGIETRSTLEVKEKIPIFRQLASQMLSLTSSIKSELENQLQDEDKITIRGDDTIKEEMIKSEETQEEEPMPSTSKAPMKEIVKDENEQDENIKEKGIKKRDSKKKREDERRKQEEQARINQEKEADKAKSEILKLEEEKQREDSAKMKFDDEKEKKIKSEEKIKEKIEQESELDGKEQAIKFVTEKEEAEKLEKEQKLADEKWECEAKPEKEAEDAEILEKEKQEAEDQKVEDTKQKRGEKYEQPKEQMQEEKQIPSEEKQNQENLEELVQEEKEDKKLVKEKKAAEKEILDEEILKRDEEAERHKEQELEKEKEFEKQFKPSEEKLKQEDETQHEQEMDETKQLSLVAEKLKEDEEAMVKKQQEQAEQPEKIEFEKTRKLSDVKHKKEDAVMLENEEAQQLEKEMKKAETQKLEEQKQEVEARVEIPLGTAEILEQEKEESEIKKREEIEQKFEAEKEKRETEKQKLDTGKEEKEAAESLEKEKNEAEKKKLKEERQKQEEDGEQKQEKEKAEKLEKEKEEAEKQKLEEKRKNLEKEAKLKQEKDEAEKQKLEKEKRKQEEEFKLKQEKEEAAKLEKEKEEAEKQKLEEERQNQEKEAKLKQEKEETVIQNMEKERQKQEKEAKLKQEKHEAEKQKLEEEKRKQEEEEAKLKQEKNEKEIKEAEKQKLEEEKQNQEKELLKQEKEKAVKLEKEKEEAEKQKLEEEKRKQEEEEAKLKQKKTEKEIKEAEKQKLEEEKQKQEKEFKLKQEKDKAVKLEKEKEEAEKQKLEEERQKQEEEKQKLEKETKLKQEKEKAVKLEKEKEEAEKIKLEEERLKQEQEAKMKNEKEKKEKEEKEKEEAEKQKLEEERQKQEKEAKFKHEKEEAEKQKLKEEKLRQEEEIKIKQEKENAEKLEKEKKEAEKKELEEEEQKQEKQTKLKQEKEEKEKKETEKQKIEEEKRKQEEEVKLKQEKEKAEMIEKEKKEAEKKKMEEEKQKQEEEKRKQEEETKLKQGKEEKEKKEAEKQKMEEERRKHEEEANLKHEKEKAEKSEKEKKEAEKQKIKEEERKQEEKAKMEKEKEEKEKKKAEKKKMEEEKQKQEEEKRKQEEETKLKQGKEEAEKKKMEEEKQKQEEEKRKQEEETKLKQGKEEKEKKEAEKQKMEEERRKQEEEAKLKHEKEKAEKLEKEKKEAEKQKIEEEERKQEDKAKMEKEKKEKEKKEAEKKKVEDEKQKQEEEAELKQEKVEKLKKEKIEAEKIKLEEEKQRQEEEAKLKQEKEEKEKKDAEKQKLVEEKRKQEEETKLKQEKETAEKLEKEKKEAEKQILEEEKRKQEEKAKMDKEKEEKEKKEAEKQKLKKEKLKQEKEKRKQEEEAKLKQEKEKAEKLEKEKKEAETQKIEEEERKQEEIAKLEKEKEKKEVEKQKSEEERQKQEEEAKLKQEKEKAEKLKEEMKEAEKQRLVEERKNQVGEAKLKKEKEEAEKLVKEKKEADKRKLEEEKRKQDEEAKLKQDKEEAEKLKQEKKEKQKIEEVKQKQNKEAKLKKEQEEAKIKKEKADKLEEEKKVVEKLEEEKLKKDKKLKEKKTKDAEKKEIEEEKRKQEEKIKKLEQEKLRSVAEESELRRVKKEGEEEHIGENLVERHKEQQRVERTAHEPKENGHRRRRDQYEIDKTTTSRTRDEIMTVRHIDSTESRTHTSQDTRPKEDYDSPTARRKYESRDKPTFVDHNHKDYTMEFARPSGYREKTFDEKPSVFERDSFGRSHTIYKAHTLVMDSQLRSSLLPPKEVTRRSDSERRSEVRHKSKAASESRSILSEKRSSVPRDIKRKPVFSTYLTDRTAVEGSRVKMTCSVLSSSDPTITWYKNGVVLDNKLKYRTKFVDGLITMEVLNAVPSDSAEYSCTVENENGSVSSSANLKVYPSFEASPIPPTFTRSIRDTYHLAENELVLECRIRGQPLPTITWMKDDKPISGNERYEAFYLADGVCRLAISHPTPEDSGKYTCKAENSVWSDQITHVVSFTGKESRLSPNLATIERSRFNRQAMESRRPHFANVLNDYKVVRGGTIGLQVEIRGDPTRIEWLREGRSVTEVYRNAKTFVEQDLYTLALSDVTEKESGLYTCRAWSSHGTVDMNAAITVVQPNELDGKPATIAGRPEKDVLICVGEDLNISFRAKGDPKPKVLLMKGMRDISNSQRVSKMTSDDYVKFTLKRSVMSDAGTYGVLARNAYGCDRAFVTVVVRQRADSESYISDWDHPAEDTAASSIAERQYKSVPERIPGEPNVVDGGSNWVSLAWPKPDNRYAAPVLAYRLESWQLGKEGGARWQELGITPLNNFDAFNLKQGEEYHFRVTPRNRYGWGESVQTTRPIKVGLAGDQPEFVEILPGQLKVLIGETANLSCSVKGNPTPSVVWMKNGHEVEDDERVRSSFDGMRCRLSIEGIQAEDEARYSCEASNAHGRASTYARLAVVSDRLVWEADAKLKRERSAEVDGDYPPQFTMRLRDRRVQATYPVRLTCQVIGNPPPTVAWLKDTQPVTLDGRRTASQDEHFHTLEIERTTLEDGGVYEAAARNSSGAISCHCSLVVDKGIRAYVAPEFCLGLEPLYRLHEGEELRITAVVEAYPSVGVTWYRDGVRLRPSRRAIMTLDHDGQIELALASITPRDAGVYTCTASNEVGRVTTSGKVEVIGDSTRETKASPPMVISPDVPYSKEPMFIRKPRSSEALEGDTVIIACEVIGDPKPDVYWLRDFLKPDYYRDANHFKRVGAGPEYRFEIPHAKLDYTGAYSVVAKNVHGEAKAIISLQIKARDPDSREEHNVKYGRVDVIPRFERELTDLLCHDGDVVEFECRVTGRPEPNIRWFHYNELIRDCDWLEATFDEDEGTARLRIKQVTGDDEGTYTCEAANNLGKATSSACLVVYPPGEPNTLSQQLRRPPALLSAASTPRSTPRSTPARSMSRTPGPDPRRLCSPPRQMAPKFYTYPFNKVVEEGESVVFQCAVKGLPSPWATWDKDGEVLTPSARFRIREKDDVLRILEIDDVTVDDVGVYRVTLENDHGLVDASARLEVITRAGKFHAGVRPPSPSPRRMYHRRHPSTARQD